MIKSYADYEWFLQQDLSRYSGKWLAIMDKKVIASDRNMDKVMAKVKKEFPNKKPFLTKIRSRLSIL